MGESFQLSHSAFDSLPSVPTREVLGQFENDRSTVLNERGCDVKELQPEPGDRIATMNRFATITFESLEQIISEQLDQQIQFIGLKIACRNAVDQQAIINSAR